MRHPAPSARARRAFTLIELLTVIAIIGILAAIIIPVVGKVRQAAKTANCTSNLRQIATAAQLYASDNKQFLPHGSADANGVWSALLQPYFGQAKVTGNAVLFCPSEEHQPTDPAANGWKKSNYGANPNVLTDKGAGKKPVGLGKIPRPAQVMMFADSGVIRTASNTDYGTGRWGFWDASNAMTVTDANAADDPLPYFEPGTNGQMSYRHSDRLNVAFVDGHVSAFAKGQLLNRNVQIAY